MGFYEAYADGVQVVTAPSAGEAYSQAKAMYPQARITVKYNPAGAFTL